MPIAKLTASEAIESVKSNPYARWPKRSVTNRLSPMAKPHFTAGFTLPKDGTIFTIGSCFARNVERALGQRGFKLPALDVLDKDDDFATVGSRVLNNYGAPSICNELKWAFEDEIDEDACFYETASGWVDLHLLTSMRPADLETVRLRRRAIRESYRSIETCDAVIITLGLSEVWFDTQTGYYLNMGPRRSILRDEPDRFELHVLSFGETMSHLREAIALIREKGRDDVRVVLTVSPVPLTATHRDTDVMIANTYSKSVLRTVAEEIVHEFDFVDYFPSFESITLSERAVAYAEDEVHVTPDIVDLNIGRMVQAYVGETRGMTIEDARSNIDTYRNRPKIGFEELSINTDLCSDPQIAAVLCECSIAVGRLDVAELALSLAEDPTNFLEAQLLMARDDFAGALAALNGQPDDARQLARYFGMRIRASAITGRYDGAVEAAQEWSNVTPNSPAPFKILARTLAEVDDPRAKIWFDRAVDVSGGNAGIILDMAEFLMRTGRGGDAKIELEAMQVGTDQETRRKTRLLRAI